MQSNKKQLWLATLMLVATLTACGGGGDDESDTPVYRQSADQIQSALTIRQTVQQATIISGAAPKSTATDEAPALTTDGAALQSVSRGDTVDLGLTISALEGVSSLLARVEGATSYLQIDDPNLSASGSTAKAGGSATVFSGQVQVHIPSSVHSGQFCIEFAAVDQAGRVSNYRKVCFQLPENIGDIPPPQVNAGGDLAVGDDAGTVALVGEAKAAGGATITAYRWRQLGDLGPVTVVAGSLSGAEFSFEVPDVVGAQSFGFELVVTDSGGRQARDTVDIDIVDRSTPLPPQVSVGASRSVDEGASLTISGSATDPDGFIASLRWSASPDGLVTIAQSASRVTEIQLGRVTVDTPVELRLEATDNSGLTSSNSFTLTVRDTGPEPVTLRLSGTVAEAGYEGAEVTVTAGSDQFTGQVDAQGRWQADVTVLDQSVFLHASVTHPSRSAERLEALLGDFGSALAAGNGAQTSEQHLPMLTLGYFGTALAARIRWHWALQSGQAQSSLPADTSALASAARGVDPMRVLHLSVMQELLAQGLSTLPQGVEDTLALLASREDSESVLVDLIQSHGESYRTRVDQILAAPMPTLASDHARPLEHFVNLGPSRWFLASQRVELLANGSARVDEGYTTPQSPRSASGTWAVSAGKTQITYSTAPTSTFFSDDATCGDDPTPRNVTFAYTPVGVDVTPLWQPEAGLTLAIWQTEFRTDYPDNPECEPVVEAADPLLLWLQEFGSAPPFPIAISDGTVLAISVPNTGSETNSAGGPLMAFRPDRLRFQADGSGTMDGFALDGEPTSTFSWRMLVDGALEVVDANQVTSRYYGWARQDAIGFEVFHVTDAADGYRSAARQNLVPVSTPAPQMTDAVAAADWAQFGHDRWFSSQSTVFSRFGLRLRSGGTGVNTDRYLDEDTYIAGPETSRQLEWALTEDGLDSFWTYDSSTGSGNCTYDGVTCQYIDQRRWVPVAAVGDRYYFLEDRLYAVDSDPATPPELRYYSELRYYDRSELPAAGKGIRTSGAGPGGISDAYPVSSPHH